VPYFITDSADGCNGWATIKDDGEVIGCHATKQAAIDQMVAVSIAEDIEPGGERAVTVPKYVQDAAARGLQLRRDGFGGDGLTEQTIREARLMARGQMSDDKVVRANAWAARHTPDLRAPQNSDPDHPRWPGPGAVAHYLWGIDPLNPEPARAWLARQAENISGERNDMTKVEMRQVQVQDLEVREVGNGATFMGYAAVFNSDSEPLPFVEQIRPGAFQRTLSSRNNIKMFVNHDDTMVLASTRSGTLRLAEDSRGLKVEADLPQEVTYARDLTVLMRKQVVDSMSFGFSVPPGGDEWSQDGQRRFLNEVRLHEVSVVTGFPAYEATSATIRKAQLLAQRTQTDADALADALTALEMGNQLSDDQASLLVDVVERQRVKAEAQENPADLLNVLRDKLELLAKAV
jgi:HK97 family phage prohead protease